MGHLINPIQFRLGYSLVNNKNWPALNKEQYMLCYNIQKDFTDYFKTIFGLRKKLVLKRRNRKRRIFTKVKHPKLIFSSCNVNFFGFNLHRVLVDVTVFDMRFESKWDSLFSRKYFENFLFKFGQVFRTSIIVSQPEFFINIKKELLKKFFIILNKQYHFIAGTLISQTTKWVKSYLAKVYQKFFSFFNDSAYLVNKRKTLRNAKQYIKKRTKDQHVFISLKYKKRQKKKLVKKLGKIFFLLNPINSRSYLKIFKNKKKIVKIKKLLIKKNKYLFNFSDLFDIYFKLITHKFAKKVRRRDLPRFRKLIESSKTRDYYKSILKNIKYGFFKNRMNKKIYSLIPLEDKIRLYKAQSHYYLKYIILKKKSYSLPRYNRLRPVSDLYKKFFKKFDRFRPYITRLQQPAVKEFFQNNVYTNKTIQIELMRFKSRLNVLFFLATQYNLQFKSLFRDSYPNIRSNIYLIFPKNKHEMWYRWFFRRFISEFVFHSEKKYIFNKKFFKALKKRFFIKVFKFQKYTYTEEYVESDSESDSDNFSVFDFESESDLDKNSGEGLVESVIPELKEEKEIIDIEVKKHPSNLFFPLKFKNSFIYKNLLRNWIIKEGNLWLDQLLINLFDSIKINEEAIKSSRYQYRRLLVKYGIVKKLYERRRKKRRVVVKKENESQLANNLLTLLSPFVYNKKDLIWNTAIYQKVYYKGKINIYNTLYNNNDYETFVEMEHSKREHTREREKSIRGSVIPLYFNKYRKKKEMLELPAFGVDTEYKHFESSTILSNLDPALSEKRPNRNYFYKLDPFFQKYMKLQKIKSLQINVNVDLGSKKMITAQFLSAWLKSLFKKGRKLTYVLRTLDRFIKPANNYISAVSVLFAGRFTRSAYTTYKYYRFGRLNSGEITKQMDYSHIEFTTKFGMCGIKVKLQYKVNIFAHRDLANYLKNAILSSEATPYKFDLNLHLPMLIKYGSKKLFRIDSKLIYRNNLPFHQFK